jgi:superfamily II DNA or RNA helicase
LAEDFFDVILVDEGHHNVAESWDLLRNKFPNAKIINFSATPSRADGQLMAGKIIYSYPVSEAITSSLHAGPDLCRYGAPCFGDPGAALVRLDLG